MADRSIQDGVGTHVVEGVNGQIDLDVDGLSDIGADLTDADLLIVDDGGAGTNRKAALSRMWTYIKTKVQAAALTLAGKLTLGDSATTAPLSMTERSAAPTSPASGDLYLDDGTNTASGNPGWRRYTGSAWEDVSAAAGSGGGGFDWTTENDVTTDQSPTTSDLGELYRYTSSTTADRTLTLPSVGSGEDGEWLAIRNAGKYMVYVTASDSDTIGWPSLAVQSLEMLGDSFLILRYSDTHARWEIIEKSGAGQVRPKGTVLYLASRHEGGAYSATGGYNAAWRDVAERNHMWTNSAYVSGSQNAFGQHHSAYFPGSAFFRAEDCSDFDMLGSTSNAKTLVFWARNVNAAGASPEIYASHYEDAGNEWCVLRGDSSSGGTVIFQMNSGGANYIQMIGTTAIPSYTWVHIAIVQVGTEIGLYVNGNQEGYDGAWPADTFSGHFYLGQFGNDSGYLVGHLDDFAIVHSNIFGAAPNSGNTDTINIDTLNPLGLVI